MRFESIFEKRLEPEKKTPRPGFEPGSKDPQSSRMSATLPGQAFWCMPYLNCFYRLNISPYHGLIYPGNIRKKDHALVGPCRGRSSRDKCKAGSVPC